MNTFEEDVRDTMPIFLWWNICVFRSRYVLNVILNFSLSISSEAFVLSFLC